MPVLELHAAVWKAGLVIVIQVAESRVAHRTWKEQGANMRFYQGDHAYEVEKVLDPATQLYSGWRYNVYRVRPVEKLLRSGKASTQQEAERRGRQVLAQIIRAEHKSAVTKRAA